MLIGEMMISKNDLIRKYKEYKDKHQTIPKYLDFCKFAEIHKSQLIKLFGRDAYAKLQQECGDEANKLIMERTSRETIMRRYGDLALKLGELPKSSDWMHSGLKPSISGLEKRPHFIKWSEFPQNFFEWAKTENIYGDEEIAKASTRLSLEVI